jgi:PadR family transcriptional regulator PadR
MSRESLGHFELLVLLAILRVGRVGDEAYGVPIAQAIEQSSGKPVILASVYNTLERLEEKGMIRSTIGQPTPERGGRAKRYFAITTAGRREVSAAKKALTVLWRGIPLHEG